MPTLAQRTTTSISPHTYTYPSHHILVLPLDDLHTMSLYSTLHRPNPCLIQVQFLSLFESFFSFSSYSLCPIFSSTFFIAPFRLWVAQQNYTQPRRYTFFTSVDVHGILRCARRYLFVINDHANLSKVYYTDIFRSYKMLPSPTVHLTMLSYVAQAALET